MTVRKRTHSETRWQQLPPTVVRCGASYANGSQCRREAEDGSVVCDQHGGAAPQVRRRAADRIMNAADLAIQKIIEFVDDPEVPYGVRLKAAQDLADRAGLQAAQVHQIIPADANPITEMYQRLLSDPANLAPNPDYDQPAVERDLDQRAIDAYGDRDVVISGDEFEHSGQIVELRNSSSEPEDASDTPSTIHSLMQSGAFDRRPRS
jgi:hypothetical protein